MGRRIEISVGEIYHIYNRGVDKRVIFKDKYDHLRFIVLLKLCNDIQGVDVYKRLKEKGGPTFLNLLKVPQDEQLVSIGAYCLMPNHFHLLIKEQTEGGISLFMKKLATAYSMYFNWRYQRTGALFQGRYKAKHVDTDEYLKYLYAYIHLNPISLLEPNWKGDGVKDVIRAREYLHMYDYSSYSVYSGKETLQKNIVDRSSFPDYFSKRTDLEDLIDFWLKCSQKHIL